VQAALSNGKLKYKRSGRENPEGDDDDGNDETERKRLDDFAKWLESDRN